MGTDSSSYALSKYKLDRQTRCLLTKNSCAQQGSGSNDKVIKFDWLIGKKPLRNLLIKYALMFHFKIGRV